MGALTACLVIITLIVAVALVVIRINRGPDDVAPKRREFNRIRAQNRSAQETLNAINEVVGTYRLSLDEVGNVMAQEIIVKLKDHSQKMMEINK